MPTDSSLQLLITQIDIFLIFLARPLVQRQIVAVMVILIAGWYLPEIGQSWLRKRERGRHTAAVDGPAWWRRGLAAIEHLYSPLLTLILVQLTIWLFIRLNYPVGILHNSIYLILIWLAYRLVLMGMYAYFGPAARPYHRWILLPVFMTVLGVLLVLNTVGLNLVIDAPLFTIFGTTVTLRVIFFALVVLYCFVVAAWITEILLYRVLNPRLGHEPGVVNAVTTISRYFIFLLGVVAVLQVVGLDPSTLALIGGGLSVGIGFGLQQIVADFISGLILLLEQAVRPGDVIDLNGEIGVVDKLSTRATTVRTIDNVELIIPNQTFLTNQITTFTKTETKVRMMVPLGVSYNSNPKQVRQIALQTAARHGLVLSDPEPMLLFRGFGDSSLNFDLAVWIDQPSRRPRVRSDLYYMLWDAFVEHSIEIPFPQRDLNLRTGWEHLRPT
ncbi:MAG: mechanosensitive ion channel [Anaerolineaceae bacterium]|nr:mechanosensitive ion channel [Anaerolineaceae bacterium]MCB9102012.1 mechanosensitive ion channel [Anaerolineales bacterium]